MKTLIYISIAVSIITTLSCSKTNEMPPPNGGFIRDYVLPTAGFLTPEEREILNTKREEYNSIL